MFRTTLNIYQSSLHAEPQQTILLAPKQPPILLGSAPSCTIQLADGLVEAQHAELRWQAEPERWVLVDLGSQFGTFLRQPEADEETAVSPDEPLALADQATISIGRFWIKVIQVEVDEKAAGSSGENGRGATNTKPQPKTELLQPANNGISGGGNEPPDDAIVAWGREHSHFPNEFRQLGFEQDFSRLVQYLPTLYDVPFVHRFLALFESLLSPLMWTAANVDAYLDPHMTPADFLPWLAGLYGFEFDHTWTEAQRRQLVQALPIIFRLWGTKQALQTTLEIYTGKQVSIIDDATQASHAFKVILNVRETAEHGPAIRRLILSQKPAHTQFEVAFTRDRESVPAQAD